MLTRSIISFSQQFESDGGNDGAKCASTQKARIVQGVLWDNNIKSNVVNKVE